MLDYPPRWWRAPEHQLQRARELWPDIDLPEPPKDFFPQASSEVLLLHVPGQMGNLWDLISVPSGYTKSSAERLRGLEVCVVHRGPIYTQPTWVGYDPARTTLAETGLATYEVLSAAIQFPDHIMDWGDITVGLAYCSVRYMEINFHFSSLCLRVEGNELQLKLHRLPCDFYPQKPQERYPVVRVLL